MTPTRAFLARPLRALVATGLLLAAGCGPDASTVVNGIHAANPVVREDMVEFARKFDEPKVVDALIGALQDESVTIRATAAESLGELGHVAAAPALVQLLEDEPSEQVRAAAVEALGRLADPVAVAPLMRIVETSEPDEAPLNAIWALGNIADKRALDLLSRIREEATDPHVLYNTNVALRKIK